MKGALFGSFNRWKSPGAHRTTSQIVSLIELKIELMFGRILTDSVGGELDTVQPEGLDRLRTHAWRHRSRPAAMAPGPGHRC
jgi:hypothetical protein